jgi:hypothetical protein
MELDSSFIFKRPVDTEKQEENVEYFTILDKQDYLNQEANPCLKNDGTKACAKIVTNYLNNTKKYFIKIDHNGKLINPMSIYTSDKDHFVRELGKKIRYKSVSPKVFETYMYFLRTKNIAWLNNAEREMA